MTEIPTNRAEFERQLKALLGEASPRENPGSYRSTGCERCYDCMFTTGSTQCYKCTYCTDCENSTNCTHCTACVDCHGSNYSVRSRQLSGCSYVVLSQNCYDCVFCFGCSGLVKKEFHILNQPFPRDEYFRLTRELQSAFGL